MTFWQQLVIMVSTPTLVITVGGFVAKSLFSRWLSRDLEKFRAQMQQRETEHRAELDRIAYERQVCFSSLHQKRAEVIEEVYKSLVMCEEHFCNMTSRVICEGDPTDEEKIRAFTPHAQQFLNHYGTHKIFLSKSTCDLIDEYAKILRRATIDHQYWLSYKHDVERDKELMPGLYDDVERAKELMPEIRRRIEAEFRAILGASNQTLTEVVASRANVS